MFLFPGPLAQGASVALISGCLGPGSQQNVNEEGAFPQYTDAPPHAANTAPNPRNFPSLTYISKEENH